MNFFLKRIIVTSILLSITIVRGNLQGQENPDSIFFTFTVTCDMREWAGPDYQDSRYYLGVCQAIERVGKGAFIISPVDIDPPWYV